MEGLICASLSSRELMPCSVCCHRYRRSRRHASADPTMSGCPTHRLRCASYPRGHSPVRGCPIDSANRRICSRQALLVTEGLTITGDTAAAESQRAKPMPARARTQRPQGRAAAAAFVRWTWTAFPGTIPGAASTSTVQLQQLFFPLGPAVWSLLAARFEAVRNRPTGQGVGTSGMADLAAATDGHRVMLGRPRRGGCGHGASERQRCAYRESESAEPSGAAHIMQCHPSAPRGSNGISLQLLLRQLC
ncbi:hypothetical protein FN846DRAFT_88057 [Sphaerosporella brunnea]|uniref:Uncharacterized protein n=1 Tax=Sphaerosporella brunnea TaxID=1250544 RepID=A0A5J5ES91_9PEZI|nr:hypothetical protein FN846DRAFT_88057 [Sphaerosporella brunnea]